jgi:CsoR family transcriptional regulator, copper-sensing transcriptional repressor
MLQGEQRRACLRPPGFGGWEHMLRGVLACVDGHTLRWYKRFMQQEMKEKRLQRLARIEGQVRGIARMVGDDRYCIDILTQIAAVQAALRKVESEILQNHVNTCVEHAITSGNAEEQRRKVAELMEVLNRSLG